MSRRRTTFGKLQRDRDKQAKQRAKQEKRAERSEQGDEPDEPRGSRTLVDQSSVLEKLAELHAAFDDGKIGFDDFEAQTRRADEPAPHRLSGSGVRREFSGVGGPTGSGKAARSLM